MNVQGKKLILLGARDGISGEAMRAALAESGAEIIHASTECLGCSVVEALDRKSQERILEAARDFGAANLVVVLGSADSTGARIYAETVTRGDPERHGKLGGVALGLNVYHVLEDEIRGLCPPALWEETIGMMARVLARDRDALIAAVAAFRRTNAHHAA